MDPGIVADAVRTALAQAGIKTKGVQGRRHRRRRP